MIWDLCFIDFNNVKVFVKDYTILLKKLVNIKPLAYKFYIKYTSIKVKNRLLDHDFCYLIENFMYNNEMTIEFLNKSNPYSVKLLYNSKDFY